MLNDIIKIFFYRLRGDMKPSSNANTSKASLLYEVRSELECPICREYFTEPKQLLCGHTFCNQCLIRASNENTDRFSMGFGLSNFELNNSSTFQCPQCRQNHRGRIQDIGTNYILKDMVEKLKGAPGSDEEPEPCSKCARLTSTTELFLCNTCPTNSAQPQPKYCSLCTIQQHNGHTLKPYQEIVMQKGLDQIQIKAQLLHESFQNNKGNIQTAIVIANQTLNSMKDEFDEMTVPIHDRFVTRPISDNLQYYTMEVKDNLEKEFIHNQLLNARMEKYSKALKTFLEKFLSFDDYAKKFLKLDAPQFENIDLEKLAFDEIRQPTERHSGFGFGDHPYFYIPGRQVARRGGGGMGGRGGFGSYTRRPPAVDYSPNLFDLESDDSDNDVEIATREIGYGQIIGLPRPASAISIFSLPSSTGELIATDTRPFSPPTPPPNGNGNESRGGGFGARSRPVFHGRGGGFGCSGGNRPRRAIIRFSDNNASAGRGGGRGGGGGFGGGRSRGGGNNNNTQIGQCNKCHSSPSQCRCNNTASRGGGSGGRGGGNTGTSGPTFFFPAPPPPITSNNTVSFPPPLTISTGGGRGRGGGLFPAYHHVGFGRGRGGGFSADNNSQSSIVAQNGSINGNSNPSSSADANNTTSSTTANRFGQRGGFGSRGRSTSTADDREGVWGEPPGSARTASRGWDDPGSDLSMESIRD